MKDIAFLKTIGTLYFHNIGKELKVVQYQEFKFLKKCGKLIEHVKPIIFINLCQILALRISNGELIFQQAAAFITYIPKSEPPKVRPCAAVAFMWLVLDTTY